MNPLELAIVVIESQSLFIAFFIVGLAVWIGHLISVYIFKGRIHDSAIAIFIGLIFALIGGIMTGGEHGLADISLFSGLSLLGGIMFRDLAIVSVSYGAKLSEMKKAGVAGALSLGAGITASYIMGLCVAFAFGYRDPIDLTAIAAGAVTFIVGPVTATAIGASSSIIALSIAVGVVKTVFVMMITPVIAKPFEIDNPQAAMVYGGLVGTTSGAAAGLLATDPKLVPYGAVVATFYTGAGCLICPSIFYYLTHLIFG